MASVQHPDCVVVGVDGSVAGLAATRWAAAEAAQRHVALRVVQVQAPHPQSVTCAAVGLSVDLAIQSRSADVVRRAVREVRSVSPDLPVTGEVIFGNVVSGLLAAGCRSQLIVLGSRSVLPRSLTRSWSCAAAVVSKAAVPVTVVEPTIDGNPAAATGTGAVVVMTDQAAYLDRAIDYGCAQAERRRSDLLVLTLIKTRRRDRERARTTVEEALFDILRQARDRWPAVRVAGLVSTSKADAEVRSRLSRAELVVIDGQRIRRTQRLLRRCRLAGPLGMRTGPCALTVLPT
jgi:hypothetical protein